MVIEELILESLGADTEHHATGSTIFMEGSTPNYYFQIVKSISNSMYFRYLMGQYLSSQNPVSKLRTFMDYLKGLQTDCKEQYSFKIPLTRQQMANFTGLCVETTIRTLKVMEKNNIVKIQNHKVFY